MGPKQWNNKSSLCQINIQNYLIFFYIHGTNNQSLLVIQFLDDQVKDMGRGIGYTQASEMFCIIHA